MDTTIILLPVSAIIPTKDRSTVLADTLISLSKQEYQPQEIIVIDASTDRKTELVCVAEIPNLKSIVVYEKATYVGAAKQRNQGLQNAKHAFVFFMDDDILFEEYCIEKLWKGIYNKSNVGGVNAFITNQHSQQPGKITSLIYNIIGGRKYKGQWGGKCFGPAINVLPTKQDAVIDYLPVEWLNSTCTIYRKESLPNPVFDQHFTGYSFMEDVALSLQVGKRYRLITSCKSAIFHDSQPSDEKKDKRKMAEMELVNRYYVMSKIMGQKGPRSVFQLIIQQLFSGVSTSNILNKQYLLGKYSGLRRIIKER
ncbi:MAG: glycosyltransferase family 2 protein [Filimonas sp.]|nr:glycosyltransferase family 2 protein [Filimonas sp.]